MNTRLQKEITNFVNLKMRIAFLKSGINNETEIIESSDDFFKNIEDQIIFKLDNVDFPYDKN